MMTPTARHAVTRVARTWLASERASGLGFGFSNVEYLFYFVNR
jgi:hypothetical protein